MMFWSVGFVLTLAVQVFASTLFDIDFRKIEPGEPVVMQAGERLNIYLAALDQVPDVEKLKPRVTVTGSDAQALSVEPFDLKLTRPGKDGEPVYAHALYSVVTTGPQELTLQWENPHEGRFLAASNSLMLSTIAFFSLILLSLAGAALLYAAWGNKVLQRLTITPPQADTLTRGS